MAPEPTTTAVTAASGLFGGGVAATVIKWLVGREVRRIDNAIEDHGDRISEIEQSCAKEAALDSLRGEMREGFGGVHSRIDKLFERLPASK